MRFGAIELLHGKYTSRNSPKRAFLLLPFFLLLILVPLPFIRNLLQPSAKIYASSSLNSTQTERCDIFSGKWVPHPKAPYYSNETCHFMLDQQNCLKFGRPDTEFLKWRWRPDECELPIFDAAQFLKLVKGKSLAFVGDSVGRNQMQSLVCLLSAVSHPEDISKRYASDGTYFKRWFYADYSFTLAILWSPYLVKALDADPHGHSYNSLMNLYLDKVDQAWATEIDNFDFVIISAGQWFFRPIVLYENGQVVGCHKCQKKHITHLSSYYGYRKAFRTAFRAILNSNGYKGVTFLRTFSPAHFENGDWNKGGSCVRTRPFSKEEMKLDGYILEMYLTQVEEFRVAEKKALEKGLKFLMLDTTEIMLLRPDGHPNNYGHPKDANVTLNDCVHWCLPGPVDTWNEFLLYMMKMESQRPPSSTLQRYF